MATEFKDYYSILGVSRQANRDEIRKAFRKLARKYHPDVAKDKTVAEQKFKEINEAYEVLGDPEKRKRYDELGSAWREGGSYSGAGAGRRHHASRAGGVGGAPFEEFDFHFGGTGFSDFFEQFFGSGGSTRRNRRDKRRDRFSGGQHRTGRRARGQDIEVDAMVGLEEAFTGTVRTISVKEGRGGTHGGGGGETCQVKIPPGVQAGQRLRIKTRGEKGIGGGPPGDLYLRIHIAEHPDFRLEKGELIYDLPVTPWEAVLGASVTIPTPAGEISIRIPAGTQSGARLRLKGYGMSLPAGGGRGELFVVVQVKTPTDLTEKERKLWEQLAEESKFQARD